VVTFIKITNEKKNWAANLPGMRAFDDFRSTDHFWREQIRFEWLWQLNFTALGGEKFWQNWLLRSDFF
jgi:hypothetical protein